MITAIIIFCVTAGLMISSIIAFPEIKIKKLKIGTYWIITLLGAAAMLLFAGADIRAVGQELLADTAVNPIKILILFISMTILSVFLDELGFFRRLALLALKLAGAGQRRLFFCLYATVSVLTVFTSNDVIILSFTPFICYFAKHANINPTPYLAAEFVAANTWSMALIIGNPTNIYLATAYGINFLEYLKVSIIPTVFAGAASLLCLYLMFFKQLKQPLQPEEETFEIEDKPMLIVALCHLGVCTLLLAVSSYIGLPM